MFSSLFLSLSLSPSLSVYLSLPYLCVSFSPSFSLSLSLLLTYFVLPSWSTGLLKANSLFFFFLESKRERGAVTLKLDLRLFHCVPSLVHCRYSFCIALQEERSLTIHICCYSVRRPVVECGSVLMFIFSVRVACVGA